MSMIGPTQEFKRAMSHLINVHSIDTYLDLFDYEIAEYLSNSIRNLKEMTNPQAKFPYPKVSPMTPERPRFLHPFEDHADRQFMMMVPPTDARMLYPMTACHYSDGSFNWEQWDNPIADLKAVNSLFGTGFVVKHEHYDEDDEYAYEGYDIDSEMLAEEAEIERQTEEQIFRDRKGPWFDD